MSEYIGKQLGAYRVVEQIGQGGMATIYKAYQPAMDRYVAVKILPSHFTQDASFTARFTQEARTLARLEHPHILPVHDYGEQEGIAYLVMRYINAGTLKDLIAQRGALSLKEAARIFDQVGRALGYAHSQGVIHRDIKPGNILIDERGDAFLTDFGIAKLVEGTAQFTATGAVVGTPAYMSPEQGMGMPADKRSDIYALGVMLYEMVTGRVPFEAETPLAVLLKHVNAPLPPPRQIKPDLPEAVERVILNALAKSPDDRFQSAEQVAEAFQKAVAGLPLNIAAPHEAPTTAVKLAKAQPDPTVAMPPRRAIPWLPIVGGVAGLAFLIVIAGIAAVLLAPRLGGMVQATATSHYIVAMGPTQPPAITRAAMPDATAEAVYAQPTPMAAPAATVAAVSIQPTATSRQTKPGLGWTNFTNANFVSALALQGSYLWTGGTGGLVRWNLQDGSYVELGIVDGLASGMVKDLVVDKAGNLWVATDAGISRFNGQKWQTFDEADGLGSDWVESLAIDAQGNLWAGTAYGQRGLNYYDGKTWSAPALPPLPFEFPRPQVFAWDNAGRLFLGFDDNGLVYLNKGEWKVLNRSQGLPGNHVHAIQPDDAGAMLVSFGNEVVRLNPDTGDWQAIEQLSGMGIYRIHRARDGALWFAGEAGAVRYDATANDWQRFEPGPDTFPGPPLVDIGEDKNGLWLASYGGGVIFYDGKQFQSWRTTDVGGNSVKALVQDGPGAIWAAFDDGTGLARYNPGTATWQTFGDSNGALDWPAWLAVDGAGHVWISGYSGQLKWYDGQDWQTFTSPQLGQASIERIGFGPGDVKWLWTSEGLLRHDPATDQWAKFTVQDHPALKSAYALYAASDGTVWAGGGGNGLAHYVGGKWVSPTASGEPPQYVHSVVQSPDGSVWVAADDVLYQLTKDKWVIHKAPDDVWVEKIALGPDGVIWTGKNYALGRYDPAHQSWKFFTTADGLVNRLVEAICVTPDGVVWIGTQGGISRFAEK
jgi:ligand-binding sensor domain-containing protein/tRNA A-37 threonylcarbamoyl transferase component Bud32